MRSSKPSLKAPVHVGESIGTEYGLPHSVADSQVHDGGTAITFHLSPFWLWKVGMPTEPAPSSIAGATGFRQFGVTCPELGNLRLRESAWWRSQSESNLSQQQRRSGF
jgi:hypothetical protein